MWNGSNRGRRVSLISRRLYSVEMGRMSPLHRGGTVPTCRLSIVVTHRRGAEEPVAAGWSRVVRDASSAWTASSRRCPVEVVFGVRPPVMSRISTSVRSCLLLAERGEHVLDVEVGVCQNRTRPERSSSSRARRKARAVVAVPPTRTRRARSAETKEDRWVDRAVSRRRDRAVVESGGRHDGH